MNEEEFYRHLYKEVERLSKIKAKLAKIYYHKHREKLILRAREWRKNNPEREKARLKEYYEKNKQIISVKNAKRYQQRKAKKAEKSWIEEWYLKSWQAYRL